MLLILIEDAAGGPSVTDTYRSQDVTLTFARGWRSFFLTARETFLPHQDGPAGPRELRHPDPQRLTFSGAQRRKTGTWPACSSGSITATHPPPPSGRSERRAQLRGGVRGEGNSRVPRGEAELTTVSGSLSAGVTGGLCQQRLPPALGLLLCPPTSDLGGRGSPEEPQPRFCAKAHCS